MDKERFPLHSRVRVASREKVDEAKTSIPPPKAKISRRRFGQSMPRKEETKTKESSARCAGWKLEIINNSFYRVGRFANSLSPIPAPRSIHRRSSDRFLGLGEEIVNSASACRAVGYYYHHFPSFSPFIAERAALARWQDRA